MITKIDKEFIKTLAREGKREDGRAFDQFRDLKIETGFAKNAEGSALVTLGETRVLAGVKLSVGTPFADTANEGVLMVNAELGPKASPEFETGPPKEGAIELARVIDRGIRESKCIDLEALCITPKEKVWMVSVDIDPINDGGNILDAAGIAAIAALHDVKIPKLDEDVRPIFGTNSGKLKLRHIPIPVTTFKVNGALVMDPDFEEEASAEARLTVTSVEGFLCAMQKGGESNFKTEEVVRAAETAYAKATELREVVKQAVGL
ncbi:MAG: exosome complex protein Rrp42 [Candidatus Aenigmatarchaeota archaeon]|nr:MAG: exosome complex protein Rrp42 [Candidatus Aenigmarchaeota archaeon]